MDMLEPKVLLKALLEPQGASLPFSAEEVARAQALVRSGVPAPAEVEALPEPLALAVLEGEVSAQRPALADALTRAGSRALAKAAKKALYRLRSQGVAAPAGPPPPARPGPGAPAAAPAELTALLSSLTGNGERAVALPRPIPGGGLEVIHAIISDELGVISLEVGALGRSAYRRAMKESATGQGRGLSVAPQEAGRRLAEAAALNLASRTPFPPGLTEVLQHLGLTPSRSEAPLPVPEPGDAARAAQAHLLHREPEIAGWLPPEPELRALSARMDEVLHSPLQLSPAQRAQALADRFRSAAHAFTTPAMRALYGRRLWEMGEFFERSGRPEPAALARAEARTLFHGPAAQGSRFVEELFEKVLELMSRGTPEDEQALPSPAGQANPPPAPVVAGERRSPGGLILP